MNDFCSGSQLTWERLISIVVLLWTSMSFFLLRPKQKKKRKNNVIIHIDVVFNRCFAWNQLVGHRCRSFDFFPFSFSFLYLFGVCLHVFFRVSFRCKFESKQSVIEMKTFSERTSRSVPSFHFIARSSFISSNHRSLAIFLFTVLEFDRSVVSIVLTILCIPSVLVNCAISLFKRFLCIWNEVMTYVFHAFTTLFVLTKRNEWIFQLMRSKAILSNRRFHWKTVTRGFVYTFTLNMQK